MAFRTWGRLLLTALGVSMLAGAGQLGIAYGFGIVRLTGDFPDVNRWPAQLAWVGWFAVTAAVVGAVLTGRLVRREGLPQDTPVQLAISGAAALGALVVAPLCMQPARAVELSAVDPVWAVGICAVAGAVVGAGAASAVLLRPPLGWNVALLGGAVWLVALVSAAPGVLSTEPLRTVRLGVLEPAWLGADRAQQLAMLLLPVVALVAGAVTGGLARRRGHVPLIGGAAGAAGPVLLAFAYLTAGPGDPGDRYQLAPYYGALIAVATGALGSVAATLLRWPLLPARPTTGAGDDDTAIEPTDILAPLPTVPAPPRPDPTEAVSAGTASTGTASTGTASDEPATVELSVAARTVDPDPPGAGRTPAHWDWPDPAATVTDRPTTRPVTPPPSGPSRTGSTSTEPTPTWPAPTGPIPTGPNLAGPNLAGPAQDEPASADPAPTGPGRSGPSPARSARAESAPIGAKQRKAATPPPGDEPVAAPKPRVKRTTRTRPATGVPVADTGRPEPDPATGVGSTEGNEPAVTEPAPTVTTGPGTTESTRPGTAGPGTARPDAAAAGALPPVAGLRHVSPDGVERTPRPRHQLPDLSGTGAPADTPRPVPARASLPFPEPDTAERTEPLGAVSLRWEADGSPTTAPVDGTTAEPASTDPASADPASTGADGQQPSGKAKGRRGLFRRNRPPEGESAAAPTAEPATADDEYVDWVAGLGKPLADNEPERESGRRSLRTSGRHHRD
ncbi:hypothetical protein GA0070216_103327 [Micromonospora matsumotoense]|uniref:Uncharacterized protein n=1 Tax=Micromonospora matsumotoense TaxID=121616 RepID=A0A1C4WH22_9ACTN|nr:hypothetical protein [Micromonospora matsumotoense]SCE95231.1 hypothetical protein GA0070216_103327 [Micromonospora matsumotoense]